MSRISRPSPAILVAVIALVAAFAGTAIAGPGASTSAVDKSDVKRIATKKANKAVNAAFPVTSAKLGTINTRTQTQTLPPTGFAGTDVTANCQTGEKAISGGVNAPTGDVLVGSSHKQGEGWLARLFNFGGAPVSATVEVYCLVP
jgi:hypothetical protein